MKKELESIISSIGFEHIEKHPNILIAARFWDEKRYLAARVCYKFMRIIDDYVDERKAQADEISCLEKEELSSKVSSWIECLQISNHQDPFYAELSQTISTFKIPLHLFHNFAKSMRYDINHTGFATFGDFLSYAEGASVAPASIFVHLCCLSEENGAYIPPDFDVEQIARPCAMFSYLVHIIRDFQMDQLDNLNYFADDILRKHHLVPSDLREIAKAGVVPDAFRSVITEYYGHALNYEKETMVQIEYLSDKLSGQYLLSLKMIYQLYKMVFDRIDVAHGNFTAVELNPGPFEIKERVMEIAKGWESGV